MGRGFGRLVERYSVDVAWNFKGSPATAAEAAEYLRRVKPLLLFVHFDDVDHAGHDHGWGSAQYLEAIGMVDGLIRKLREAAPVGKTLFVVVADHGGTGTKHGNDTTEELEVPLVFHGPGIRSGELPAGARSIDMAPSVVRLLGLQPDVCWEGRSLLR
jgi:predicted AlkP superfamily pyrophosphatase or phosphodiesterase